MMQLLINKISTSRTTLPLSSDWEFNCTCLLIVLYNFDACSGRSVRSLDTLIGHVGVLEQCLVRPDVALQKQSRVGHPLRNRQDREHGGAAVGQPHVQQSGFLSCFN